MKTTFLFLPALLLCINALAQNNYTITGKVVDAITNNPMQAASVFAQNTTMGTATDANGNFTLYLPNGGYDLIVTFTGYQTMSRRISTADAGDKSILIAVNRKMEAMEDVVIKASNEVKDGWEKYGSFFLDNFIGKTTNSQQCTITNKEVLKFYYYKRKDRLKVMATAPIEMENRALGYKLKYTLDSFVHEYGTDAGIYTGYPLFEEMTPTDSLQQGQWQANRLEAYNGSMLHFMRSIYNQTLWEEGFEIQLVAKRNQQDTAVKLQDYYRAINYVKDDSTQLVSIMPNQPNMAVLYSYEFPEEGYVLQNKDTPRDFQLSVIAIAPGEAIGIEQNGYYFDQNDITITGYWIWDKIGDMLPYDYTPTAAPQEATVE